jgi:acyl dehydratase
MTDKSQQANSETDVTDGIPIGIVWKSSGRTITEGEFSMLHDLTWTVTNVHTDLPFAKSIGLKERNLSGPLVISVALGLIGTTTMRRVLPPLRIRMLVMLGINNARFRDSLFPGDTIHVHTELTSARPSRSHSGRGVMTLIDRVYNQNDGLLCEFERTILYDRQVVAD